MRGVLVLQALRIIAEHHQWYDVDLRQASAVYDFQSSSKTIHLVTDLQSVL
jgi:hypothetical protein